MAASASAATGAAPVAPELRRPLQALKLNTQLPILMPSFFPHPRVPLGRVLQTTIEVSATGWEIRLDTCGDRGFAEACDLGSISADRRQPLPTKFPSVRLAGGISGRYFRPRGCGDACDRTVIWWRSQGLLFEIALRDSARTRRDPKALIVAVANSAINAGPR